jgi:AraC-like DNA-binding protein
MTQHTLNRNDLQFSKTIIEPIRHMLESKALGMSFEALLLQLGFSLEAYNSPDFKMNADEYLALHRCLKRRTGRGMQLNDWLDYYSATSAGMAGMAALSANTILDALQIPVRYMSLYVPCVRVEMKTTQFSARLCLEMAVDLGELNRFLLESISGVFNNIANQVASEKIPRTIHFRHSYKSDMLKSPSVKDLEAQCACRVRFGSDFNGLEVDKRWLDTKTRSPNAVTYHLAMSVLDKELAALSERQSFASFVRNELCRLAAKGDFPSLEVFADRLNLSPRTLIRKLAAEGTSFRALHHQVWLPRAQELLRNEQLPIKQIAARSGFGSVGAFARAFKMLVEQTPRQWQREHTCLRV